MTILVRATLILSLIIILSSPMYAQVHVTTQGDQFYCDGQIYKLKGSNYYPYGHMWAKMWSEWDWSQIQNEADQMDTYGLNCVRILVPYSNGGWDGANPPEDRLDRLESLVNLLGTKGIRSCVTLFDWETGFPWSYESRWQEHMSYMNAIVGRLKDNPYVLMWDVKNEPDHPSNINGYDNWDYSGNKTKIIDWLQRCTNYIKSIDSNHLVTAGIRWYQNTDDVLHFVDVAICHSYWAPTPPSWPTPTLQIQTIESAQTSGGYSQPIVFEEFGWPSGGYREGSVFTEIEQEGCYIGHINAWIAEDTAGGIQWQTFNGTGDSSNFENHFGLGVSNLTTSLKLAGVYYRDNYPVSQFPVLPDTTPPGPVEYLSTEEMDMTVKLFWKTPGDYDLDFIVIRSRTDQHPTGPADGDLVYQTNCAPGTSMNYNHTNLINGVTYYYAAYMCDTSGHYSAPVYAQGTPVAPTTGSTCAEAKAMSDGSFVELNHKIVTGSFFSDSCLYIQDDTYNGIRVVCDPSQFAPGDMVNVTGRVATYKSNSIDPSEKCIQQASVLKVGSGYDKRPVHMTCKNVGGGPGFGCWGVNEGYGVNNIGLLVKISGNVKQVLGSYIYVDDGSEVQDVSGRVGVLVKCPSTPTVAAGDHVAVTGVVSSSIPIGWYTNRRFIRVNSMDDIVTYPSSQ